MFVKPNKYRKDFAAPPLSDYSEEELRAVGQMIRWSIREAVGVAGLRQWDELNPGFAEDMHNTLIEVRAQGAWDQHSVAITRSSEESWASIGRMMSAALSTKATDTPKDIALRAFAAHAGVGEESVDNLIATSRDNAPDKG